MRIITNPGSNLADEEITQLGLVLLPQQIVVDGAYHDTRQQISFATIDRWVATAKEHPYVLGSSAAECSELFRQTLKLDKRILMLTTSRHIIGTYTAATAAARSVVATAPDAAIDVVDTCTTDLGAGLVALFCAEAARAGKPYVEVVALAERFASGGQTAMLLETLDYVVRGGRASFLRAWLADILKIAPILGFVDGELKPISRVSRSVDPIPAVIAALERKVRADRTVWAGVVHGGNEGRAARLAEAIKSRWNVERMIVRPLSASIYLHAGPGACGGFVYPIDDLPFRPTT